MGMNVAAVNYQVSTVDKFIQRHPDEKAAAEKYVFAGQGVISKNGKTADEVKAMSMCEYKSYIMGMIDSIPKDATQRGDKEIISISEDGWEQMKNDPKYEAWVIGQFKVGRSVKLPFANILGTGNHLHTEHYGASIEEHQGYYSPAMGKSGFGALSDGDSTDWWERRKKRHDEEMERIDAYRQKRRLVYEQYMDEAGELLSEGANIDTM